MIPNVPNPQLIRNGIHVPGQYSQHDEGTSKEIKNRLVKAINVFRMLNNVQRSQQQNTKIRQKLYHSRALSTLICGSECWRMTEGDPCRWSVFHSLHKFCVDTVPFGLCAGLNNVWSLKNTKSYKFGSHLIIVFTWLLMKKNL